MTATTQTLADISSKFTEDTLDSIMKHCGGTKHTSYKFGIAFKPGDSYLSKVFRLCVYGTNEDNSKNIEVNLIAKAMPDNLHRRRLFRCDEFFRNEINFYTKVIPALEAFQAKRKPQNPFTEYPKCYASFLDGVNDFIVLEDVSFRGYRSPHRQSYVSLEDAKLTMRTLGRFHGISLAFNAFEPDNFKLVAQSLKETYFSEAQRAWYVDFQKLAINVAIDAISKTYPKTKYETIAQKYLQDNLFTDLVGLVSSSSKLSVFGHGDCWTPNFLTRYSADGKSEAITIIDFQLARCGSLALDIVFFIYSCTSQAMREEHYEDLLKDYHESACDLIADLGADPKSVLPWSGFLDEMKNYGRFGVGMGIEALPMSLIEDDEVADLDGIKENAVLTDVWNIKPFSEPEKQQRIAQMIKHAVDQGYLM